MEKLPKPRQTIFFSLLLVSCPKNYANKSAAEPGAGTMGDATSSVLNTRGSRLYYSHSMVLGGLDEMSYTTRFTPLTSLMIRLDRVPSSSPGKGTQSAVIPSWL